MNRIKYCSNFSIFTVIGFLILVIDQCIGIFMDQPAIKLCGMDKIFGTDGGIGIFISIPLFFGFNQFNRKIGDKEIDDMEKIVFCILIKIALNFGMTLYTPIGLITAQILSLLFSIIIVINLVFSILLGINEKLGVFVAFRYSFIILLVELFMRLFMDINILLYFREIVFLSILLITILLYKKFNFIFLFFPLLIFFSIIEYGSLFTFMLDGFDAGWDIIRYTCYFLTFLMYVEIKSKLIKKNYSYNPPKGLNISQF